MLQRLGWGASRLTWRQRHPRLTRVVVCCVLLLLIFEVGIRLLQPNGMTFTEQGLSGQTISAFQSSDPAVVRAWHAYINDQEQISTLAVLWSILNPRHCSASLGYQPNTAILTFTYDGMPIESFSGEVGTDCASYASSAGGIPDLFTQYVIFQYPDRDNPMPMR